MKIVVIGGTGLIGSKLVKKLRKQAHEAVAASPNTGVNSVTGEGLAKRAERRIGGRRCNELPFMGGRGSAEVLRDINP